MKLYFIHNEKEQLGPFTIAELMENNISGETYVWSDDMADWDLAKNVKEIEELFSNSTNAVINATDTKLIGANPEKIIGRNKTDIVSRGKWKGYSKGEIDVLFQSGKMIYNEYCDSLDLLIEDKMQNILKEENIDTKNSNSKILIFIIIILVILIGAFVFFQYRSSITNNKIESTDSSSFLNSKIDSINSIGYNNSGYSITTKGLHYKIIYDNKQPKAKVGEYIQYYSTILTNNDSVIFSNGNAGSIVTGEVGEPKDNGDPLEILTLLGKGDSASCLITAETFFKGTKLPDHIKSGDIIKLEIKIVDVFSNDQYPIKMIESQANDYIKTNNLNAIRLPSGMYYVIDNPGSGDQIVVGKKVKVNYRGTLLDGTEFDSSMQPGRTPFEFEIGKGQVIKGWDEGVLLFKVGGKGKLIIPPTMGYGEQGQGKDPSNSWLVFDIDVLSVSNN